MAEVKSNDGEKGPQWRHFILLIGFILFVLFAYWIATSYLITGRENASDFALQGQFGDMFGGANALFSALAFAGALFVILHQRAEIQRQASDSHETKQQMKEQLDFLREQLSLMKAQRESNVLAANLAPIITVEKMISEIPGTLRFHGITPEELQGINITQEEFVYLVTSFTVGGIYHRALDSSSVEAFPEDTYRGRMCACKEVRMAWPLVRRLMNPSNFITRIEKTIARAEADSSS
ncbi:MAG TPA: hypothetical protein VIT23_17935 [Terrimicrobiaceae bacterium]